MKKIYLLIITMVLLTTTGCRRLLNRAPVYRPVDFVADSLVHDDMPKAEDETREMLDELENEAVIAIPDIPQESDLLNDKNRIDVDKAMQGGMQ